MHISRLQNLFFCLAFIMAFTDDRARWRAVSTRDPAADGAFVYAVRSTRIYCRPNCSARLARRANVDYFDTPQEAEAAGYRACKRCKPELAKYDPLEDVLKKACNIIENAINNVSRSDPGKITLKEIADQINLTPRYLHKIFKDRMGCTPKEYAESVHAGRASEAESSHEVSGAYTTANMGYLTPAISEGTGCSDDDLLASIMDLVDWDYDPDTDPLATPSETVEEHA